MKITVKCKVGESYEKITIKSCVFRTEDVLDLIRVLRLEMVTDPRKERKK